MHLSVKGNDVLQELVSRLVSMTPGVVIWNEMHIPYSKISSPPTLFHRTFHAVLDTESFPFNKSKFLITQKKKKKYYKTNLTINNSILTDLWERWNFPILYGVRRGMGGIIWLLISSSPSFTAIVVPCSLWHGMKHRWTSWLSIMRIH